VPVGDIADPHTPLHSQLPPIETIGGADKPQFDFV